MRESNLCKIVTSLEGDAKKWFSETVALYEIKTKAIESAKAVTLARLAQTFPHVTTQFFKQGVARTFGTFPHNFPQVLMSTCLQHLDPDGTLYPIAAYENEQLSLTVDPKPIVYLSSLVRN